MHTVLRTRGYPASNISNSQTHKLFKIAAHFFCSEPASEALDKCTLAALDPFLRARALEQRLSHLRARVRVEDATTIRRHEHAVPEGYWYSLTSTVLKDAWSATPGAC